MTRSSAIRPRGPFVWLAVTVAAWAVACGEAAMEPDTRPPPPAPNRDPVAAGTISDLELMPGDSLAVSLSEFFRDPDGDALVYSAATSNAAMVAVSLSGETLTVGGTNRGRATVTVTATDPGGRAAQQLFTVTVVNRAPLAVDTIPALELGAGESVTLQISGYFEDPDGDGLTLAAESSDLEVAAAAVLGNRLRVTGVGRGMAVVTITARDPDGLFARQALHVTVPDRAPGTVGHVPALELSAGESAALDLSRYFSDPDGDTLTYLPTTSNADVVSVSTSGDTLTIIALARGTAVVTVTARDPGGLSARQRLVVAVPNRRPSPVDRIPDRELQARNSVGVDVSRYFTDPDGDTLAYSAASSNTATVLVSQGRMYLTLAAVGKGTATITVTATDPHGLAAQQVFAVTVPNEWPVATNEIRDVTLSTRDVATYDLSLHFDDMDDDRLSYAAEADDPGVASAVVTGSRLEVRPVAPGETTVTVTAADPDGARARSSFAVSVREPVSSLFDIEFRFENALAETHETVFRQAADFWSSALSETELSDIHLPVGRSTCSGHNPVARNRTVDDLLILVSVVDIDGYGGTLASAAPCLIRTSSLLPVLGRMRFDRADLDRLQETGDMLDVVLHEMAHVLGLGTLWERFGLLRNPSTSTQSRDTHFLGRAAIAAFDEAGGTAYLGGAKVPVENGTGSSGSDNRHWRRSVFGVELMTAFEMLGVRDPVSAITIQSLADLGYTVNVDRADGYRLPLAGAVAAPEPGRALFRGDDILIGPIHVVDANGRTVSVIGNDP